MDTEPLSDVPMPLHIEAVLPDPVDPDERRIELLASIVVEAGAVTLQDALEDEEVDEVFRPLAEASSTELAALRRLTRLLENAVQEG